MPDILIVDDEPDLREAYGYSLMRAGYRVRYAGSVRECHDALKHAAADLVILDVVLPDGNGMELCRVLKSSPEHGNTFVIHVSGQRTGAADIAHGLDTGADGYLTKPLNHLTLVAHVKALLRIRHAEQALRASEEAHRLLVLELKEANQRLHEYNRLKAEFVANISHELRTPLTAIIGFAQLATLRSDSTTLPATVLDAFERILRNGRHLLALIDDVLDLSKLEAGRMPLHCEHFDIAEVLQDAFGELQALAQQKGLRYRLTVSNDLPLAYSDPRRIRQIVMNLLSNAIKFTASGSVQLDVAALDDERFEFRVVDTGIGISPKARALIFDRFRQVDGSTTREQGGVGLGLAIVRELVRLLGGDVTLSSELGKGSSFHVVLPYSAPENKDSAADRSEDSPPDPVPPDNDSGACTNAQLVLVIEDDVDCAELLSQSVTRAGFQVRIATDGITGLKMARDLVPTVILLDVMMPGMDGWRVLRAIRADEKIADVPIIVCSIVDNRPLGYHLGASGYLLKPVDPNELTHTLHNLHAGDSTPSEGYVLVVDDERGIRELLSNALQHAGFSVRSASDGGAALRLARALPPRAILCDLMMPGGMSGFEFIARVRGEDALADVPILIVTGKDLTVSDRRLIAGQIADVIRKGDLLMSDLESRLRRTLHDLGVAPSHGQHTAH